MVEDDRDTLELVRIVLQRDGHIVETASSGSDGLWMATEFDFDVVVLDRGLPAPDGLTVCEDLRERGRWMPILMLTGLAETAMRVEGLRAGADDYLVKPFAPDELVARVQALARRAPVERPSVLTAGDISLDPASHDVRRGATQIALRPKEFSLLELFMRRQGEVLPRAEILDRVWDMNFDGMSNVVDVHVKSLRAKIDKPFDRQSIETIWRVGYRFCNT
ncbi:MAG: response regulator mprA [Acidimicrobiales bacterium]|nr:response regulator mprA [Acidimicrobiales bacterium]